MKDSLKTIMFGVLGGLAILVIAWPGLLFAFGCSSTNSCTGNRLPEMTSIPTLPAATLPAPKVGAEAVSSTPKCRIAAVTLLGAWVTAGYSETDPFTFTDIKGGTCTATFKDDVQQLFITPNLWFNGAPACTTCHFADVKKATKNMDLSSYAGILAGSGRANAEPKGKDILGGGKWDQALLHQMLYAPNGQTLIGRPAMPFGRPATVPADGPVVFAGLPGGTAPQPTTALTSGPTVQPTIAPTTAVVEIARPSNPGGAGLAVTLTGDAVSGKELFTANCAACHGAEGKAGIANPGSDDGTVPPLNPIDSTLVSTDDRVFGYNLDLFLEHGSTPEGKSPALKMPAWGDDKKLLPQQIADLIAYLISLNK
jgi:mono/diheme cytochrome c family protein